MNGGEKLKMMRRARGLTALSLGQAVGMPEMHIYYIERGRAKPSEQDARELAKFFNIPVVDLFPGGVRP